MPKYPYIKAKHNSYGAKRNRANVKYIVIHYTGNNGDTAMANANYFAHTNTRTAGAHFFVDRKGNVVKSVAMNLVAWSVGGLYTLRNGAGTYYRKCTNSNSVSIELCDVASKYPSKEQTEATKKLVKHIRKYCPNAKTIITHWMTNGKECPSIFAGKENQKKWEEFKKKITP